MASIVYPENTKYFETSRGHSYCYAQFSPANSRFSTVVFLHGFPSSSADWQRQISHVRSLGYGAIVIDSLGYGGSSKPDDISAYGFRGMSQDVVEVVSSAGLNGAHFVAHDFGSAVLARIVTFHAALVYSATFISVPFNMPGHPFDIDFVRDITLKILGFEKFAYMRYLSQDEAWKTLDEHPESTASAMLAEEFYKPNALEEWVKADKIAPFPSWATQEWTNPSKRAATLGEGYRGPTNWYKSMVSNPGIDEETIELEKLGIGGNPGQKLKSPMMFIDSAPSENSMPTPPFEQMFENSRLERVSTKGHWIMLESPDEINHLLKDFLEKSARECEHLV